MAENDNYYFSQIPRTSGTSNNNPMMSILVLLAPGFDGSILWRNYFPSWEVAKHGFHIECQQVENYTRDIHPRLLAGEFNVVITPRFIFREPWMLDYFVQTIKKLGITWIYDLDDDTLSEDIIPRQIGYWMARKDHSDVPPERKKELIWAGSEYERRTRQQHLQFVDGVTVSTAPLANVVKRYADKPVFVIPNAISMDWFNQRLGQRMIPPLTIGWSGGWRMEEDIQILAGAWTAVANRFPEVEFVIYGYEAPSLIVSVPSSRLHVIEWTDLDDYPSRLQNIDIGCCVVDSNDWNLNKSCIKWMEMSVAGSACVASDALYGEHITNGYDGLLAKTEEDWVRHLSNLVINAELRRSIQMNALRTVSGSYNIEHQWVDWVNAWQSIVDQHAEVC